MCPLWCWLTHNTFVWFMFVFVCVSALGYHSPMGLGWQIQGNPNPFGCAPKTTTNRGHDCYWTVDGYSLNETYRCYGPGRGPAGASCPVSDNVCRSTNCSEKSTGGRGAGSDHYWVDPCSSYDFHNSSVAGLGCDRTSRGTGSRMTECYSPALRKLLDDVETCPVELLLFFHNLPWGHRISSSSSSTDRLHARTASSSRNATTAYTTTLIERIMTTHANALAEVAELAAAWSALATPLLRVDGNRARLDGVSARFAQQVNDARVFSKVITGFYYGLYNVTRSAALVSSIETAETELDTLPYSEVESNNLGTLNN